MSIGHYLSRRQPLRYPSLAHALSATAIHQARSQPAVTTDVVLFTLRSEKPAVLLVKRHEAPFAGCWALPGGFLEPGEDLAACAMRELAEEAGLRDLYLEQLYTFGRPDRDPRGRVISVSYFGLAPVEILAPNTGPDTAETAWLPLHALPPMAFDHDEIIALAHQRLVAKLDYSTIAFQFLADTFTLSEIQRVYEALLDTPLDKRNFRKRILALGLIEETGQLCRNGKHRPAREYRLKRPGTVEIIK